MVSERMDHFKAGLWQRSSQNSSTDWIRSGSGNLNGRFTSSIWKKLVYFVNISILFVLKVWSKNESASSDLHIYLVETSPFMRASQFKNLCQTSGATNDPNLLEDYCSKYSDKIKIVWLSDLTQLPKLDAPQFFLANEFFDALPIQKFQVIINQKNKKHR